MGLRTRLTKVFGNHAPAQIAAAEHAAGMDSSRTFSPGEPLSPYDGYSRNPRTHNFVSGYNVATRPRTHEQVSFDTLRGMIGAYDVAQMCIWHRIDSIRALEWSLVPARGFRGDADAAIDQGMAVLERPDRQTPFAPWLAAWLYDILAYDAGALYRLRNRGDRVIGLRTVDGTTIAPLLDYWGNSPEAPASAYVQYINGLPWGQLTRKDLVYQPFRPRTNSPYGQAPLESILLNANTDLRFQQYFLQRFTEGNIPEALASAPETWTPDQIDQFQAQWDALMMGDQAIKSQIKWIPGGGKVEWSNEKDFSDSFSLFLMRKTCAAYHVVPSDLGFTENVNRSSGESQADVQHRVGDLPLVTHIQGVLTDFLRHDLGLPVEFVFDTGQEKEDRLALAQAWGIYIDKGMASADEGREKLLGLPGDPARPTPRFYSAPRVGPVPLLAIEGVAGEIDPETYGPARDQPTPTEPFEQPVGVIPEPGAGGAPAPAGASQAPATTPAVAKDATVGITAATGLVGYDLAGPDDDDDDDDDEEPTRADLAKAELTAFRRFRQARRRAGRWRDFEFVHTPAVQAHRLNDNGRLAVRKAAGQVAVAGLAVRAADTGRVLMLQRALDDSDPASGTWEFPGGHIEGTETPLQGAWREWAEETGCIPPPGEQTGTWTSPNGIYQGFVWTVADECAVPIAEGRGQISNPDDPDGDAVEAIAWWDPAQLPGNPAVRPELREDIGLVLRAVAPCDCCGGTGEHSNGHECLYCDCSGTGIGGSGPVPCEGALTYTAPVTVTDDGEYASTCPCGTPAVYDDVDGWIHADGSAGHTDTLQTVSDLMRAVAKAGGAGPKDGADWPGWQLDLAAAAYWAGQITTTMGAALTAAAAERLASGYKPPANADGDPEAATAAALAYLTAAGLHLDAALVPLLEGIYTDGYLIGLTSAHQTVSGAAQDVHGWTPGNTAAALVAIESLGATAGLTALVGTAAAMAAKITATRLGSLARVLAQGAAASTPPGELAGQLRAVLTDPARAETVAVTETTRGSGAGAQSAYTERGIERVRWITSNDGVVCAWCTDNQRAGAIELGEPFPSGVLTTPQHPRCRCAVIPA